MSDLLPIPAPQQPDPQAEAVEEILRRRKLAEMAQSLLGWSQVAQFTMNELIVELIRSQATLGFNKFHTPNGRNCILILGIGDEVVGLLTDVVYRITNPQEEENDNDPSEG